MVTYIWEQMYIELTYSFADKLRVSHNGWIPHK